MAASALSAAPRGRGKGRPAPALTGERHEQAPADRRQRRRHRTRERRSGGQPADVTRARPHGLASGIPAQQLRGQVLAHPLPRRELHRSVRPSQCQEPAPGTGPFADRLEHPVEVLCQPGIGRLEQARDARERLHRHVARLGRSDEATLDQLPQLRHALEVLRILEAARHALELEDRQERVVAQAQAQLHPGQPLQAARERLVAHGRGRLFLDVQQQRRSSSSTRLVRRPQSGVEVDADRIAPLAQQVLGLEDLHGLAEVRVGLRTSPPRPRRPRPASDGRSPARRPRHIPRRRPRPHGRRPPPGGCRPAGAGPRRGVAAARPPRRWRGREAGSSPVPVRSSGSPCRCSPRASSTSPRYSSAMMISRFMRSRSASS